MLTIPTELRASRIHGLGVFSLGPVGAGEIVSRFLPPLDVQFTGELFAGLDAIQRRYVEHYAYRSIFTGLHILPGDNDRYMNHSPAPNVGMNPDGSLTCVALRAIAAGEELTCDYRAFDADWRKKLNEPCAS